MSHKVLVGGAAYEISGGKTLISGTGYAIGGGKTLVSGVEYDVKFGPEPLIIYDGGTDVLIGTLTPKASNTPGLTPYASGGYDAATNSLTSRGISYTYNKKGYMNIYRWEITDIDLTGYTRLHATGWVVSPSDNTRYSIGIMTKNSTLDGQVNMLKSAVITSTTLEEVVVDISDYANANQIIRFYATNSYGNVTAPPVVTGSNIGTGYITKIWLE